MTDNWFDLEQQDGREPNLVIFGAPYDEAVFFRRGAAQGPERIRFLSSKLPPVAEDGLILSDMRILDLGDVEPANISAEAYRQSLHDTFLEARKLGLPLALGGDHSISIPLFAAASASVEGDFGVIWIDAHPDLCDNYQGSPYSHACVLRRALDAPNLQPAHVVMLGTRSCEVAEMEYIESQPIEMMTAQRLARAPAGEVAAHLVNRFDGIPVYLSLDIDAFDPAYAPGTGIPDAGGLSTRYVLDLLHGLAPLSLIGVDIVEVAPPLDVPSDATSLLALKVILELLATLHG